MSGRIKYTDAENIYIEISDQDFLLLKNHCNEHYDINFKINNLPYKVQHKALDYVKMFDLHSLLIANKKYDEFDHSICDDLAHHNFR